MVDAMPYVGGIMGGMEKTTVYLSEAQKAALAQAASAEGRSEATLIRAGIDVVTARHRVGEAAVAYGEDTPGQAAAGGRPRWMGRDAFVARVLASQADAALRDEVRALAPDTTDDEDLG